MSLKNKQVKNKLNQTNSLEASFFIIISIYCVSLLLQSAASEQIYIFFNSLYLIVSKINFYHTELFCDINLEKFCVFSSLFIAEYFGIFVFFIIATIIALIIVIASFAFTNQVPELEKLSPYECGFETYEAPRVKFDIKFCVIAILLIIFDVEMMYLFPWCVAVAKLPLLGMWSMIDFIIELTLCYVYVLEKEALEW